MYSSYNNIIAPSNPIKCSRCNAQANAVVPSFEELHMLYIEDIDLLKLDGVFTEALKSLFKDFVIQLANFPFIKEILQEELTPLFHSLLLNTLIHDNQGGLQPSSVKFIASVYMIGTLYYEKSLPPPIMTSIDIKDVLTMDVFDSVVQRVQGKMEQNDMYTKAIEYFRVGLSLQILQIAIKITHKQTKEEKRGFIESEINYKELLERIEEKDFELEVPDSIDAVFTSAALPYLRKCAAFLHVMTTLQSFTNSTFLV
jgi:hypothetical protein